MILISLLGKWLPSAKCFLCYAMSDRQIQKAKSKVNGAAMGGVTKPLGLLYVQVYT